MSSVGGRFVRPSGTGRYFDTNATQNIIAQGQAYPEVAVRKVPARNVLGVVTYVRVFHGATEVDGFTAFPVTAASGFFANRTPADGDTTLMDNAKRGPFSAKWTATGFADSPLSNASWARGRSIEITKIGQGEVLNGKVTSYAGAGLDLLRNRSDEVIY